MDEDAEWARRSLVSVIARVCIDDSPADGAAAAAAAAAAADAGANTDVTAGVTLVRALSAAAIWSSLASGREFSTSSLIAFSTSKRYFFWAF